jgi:hypothetical protein
MNPRLLAAALLLFAACSSDSDSSGAGGSGGKGGGGGTSSAGGRGGSTGGTTGGTGGATGGTGGATGGTGGTGGATGGTGGATGGTGGATGGTGGSTGGTGGSAGSGTDAAGGSTDAGKTDGGGMTDGPPAGMGPTSGSPSPITAGFTEIKITYNVQSPHTLPQSERYTFDMATNTHTMWVRSNDSSFQAGNGTDPRTELRHRDEYRTGTHILEADVWIGGETDRTSIMQSFSTSPPTSFMLTAWKDRTLRYYFGTGNGPVIMTDAFEKWFNLKVVHDSAAGRVTVYINDVMSMSFADRGSSWHWKNGVYGCRSMRCETRWRNLKHWVKN